MTHRFAARPLRLESHTPLATLPTAHTGHPVRIVLTTWHADGRVEQSSVVWRPPNSTAAAAP